MAVTLENHQYLSLVPEIELQNGGENFIGPQEQTVWESHNDEVHVVPAVSQFIARHVGFKGWKTSWGLFWFTVSSRGE